MEEASTTAAFTALSASNGTPYCSVCHKNVDITKLVTTPPPQFGQGQFVDKLSTLLGFEITLPLCDTTCRRDVIQLLDLLKELDKIQLKVKMKAGALRIKKAAGELGQLDWGPNTKAVIITPPTVVEETPQPESLTSQSPEPPPATMTPPSPSSPPAAAGTPRLHPTATTPPPSLPPPPQHLFTLVAVSSIPTVINTWLPSPPSHSQPVQLNADQQNPAPHFYTSESMHYPPHDDDVVEYDDAQVCQEDTNNSAPVVAMESMESDILPQKSSKSQKRKKTGGKSAENKQSKKSGGPGIIKKPPEEFLGPFTETEDGRKYYEGYEILPQDDGSYSCATCGWTTKAYKSALAWQSRREIKVHIKAKHLHGYRCEPCGKEFTCMKSIRNHFAKACPLVNQTKPLVPCAICGKPVIKMTHHLWTHKSEDEKNAELNKPNNSANKETVLFRCYKCGMDFTILHNMIRHRTTICKGTGVRPPNYVEPRGTRKRKYKYRPPNKNKPTKPRPPRIRIRKKKPSRPKKERTYDSTKRMCYICGAPLTKGGLHLHLWSHKSSAEKETALRLGAAPNSVTKERVRPLPKAECPFCKKMLWTMYLKRHMVSHKAPEEIPDIPCPFEGCDVTFKTAAVRFYHIRNVHERHKLHWHHCSAPGCNKKFPSAKKLARHIGLAHNLEKRKHVCLLCHASYTGKTQLTDHMKNHRPVEEYIHPCSHCPQKFNNTSLLKAHKNRWHLDPKEREIKLKENEKKRMTAKAKKVAKVNRNEEVGRQLRKRQTRKKSPIYVYKEEDASDDGVDIKMESIYEYGYESTIPNPVSSSEGNLDGDKYHRHF